MEIRMWIGSMLLVASTAACGSPQRGAEPAPAPSPPAAQAPRPSGAGGGGMCPMMMMDPATTQITASDTSDGVALVFTTTADVAAIRERARRIAEMNNQMARKRGQMMGKGGMQGGGMQRGGMQGGGMQGGGMQGGGMQGGGMRGGGMQGGMQGGGMQGMGMMHMQMVASRAFVEDIPGGARILLVPDDPAQVAALRQHVHLHAGMMAKGQCPMMAPPAPAPARGDEHEQHHPSGT